MVKNKSHGLSLNDEAWSELVRLVADEKLKQKCNVTNSEMIIELAKSHRIRIHISRGLRELTGQVDKLNRNDHKDILGIQSCLHDLCRDIEGR